MSTRYMHPQRWVRRLEGWEENSTPCIGYRARQLPQPSADYSDIRISQAGPSATPPTSKGCIAAGKALSRRTGNSGSPCLTTYVL